MESACFTTHPSRDTTCPPRVHPETPRVHPETPRVHPETSLSRPPPTVLVFPVMVLWAALHQLHHDLHILLLLRIQLLQFSLLILYTPPLNYSPTCEQSCFFGFLVPACARSGPHAENNFARGGRRSPNRADIAQHGAVSCCAHCVRAVHRSSWVGVRDSLFCSLCRTPVSADGSSLILTGRR
jgi:hypothetical protein